MNTLDYDEVTGNTFLDGDGCRTEVVDDVILPPYIRRRVPILSNLVS